MNLSETLTIIILAITLVISILAAGFSGWQASSAKEQTDIAKEQTRLIQQQTVTVQEAAKLARGALCQTLETGLSVLDLTRLTLLSSYSTPLTGNQQTEYKTNLEVQKKYFNRLYVDNNCSSKTSE